MTVTQSLQVGSGRLERCFELDDHRLRTVSIAGRPVRSSELRVVLDTAAWRLDIDSWQWMTIDGVSPERVTELASGGGETSGSRKSPHLHIDYHADACGRVLFLTTFAVPDDVAGLPLAIGIGGLDDEDWEEYRVYVDGVVVDEWATSGRWREPRLIRLGPLEPGVQHVLAVEVHGLQRPIPAPFRPDAEHFFFRGWLVDQFVAAGEPFEVLDDFRVSAVRETATGLECELAGGGLEATIVYEVCGDAGLSKRVTVRNTGSHPVRILDVVVEDFGDVDGELGQPTKGGRGLPVLADDLFFGLEHPAGLSQGEPGRVRVTQLAGAPLAAEAELVCAPAVVGRAAAGDPVEQAFRDYILGLRPRRSERLTAYSPLGWTDFTNDADPLPHITEALLEENVEAIEELRRSGIAFDVYMVDDWWDPSDFGVFDRARFPSGVAAVRDRLKAAGPGVGLWSATTRAVWTAERYPGVDAATAGGVDHEVGPAAQADLEPDDLFLHTMMGEKRFCWAAEPFRSAFLDGLLNIVRGVDAALLKLDCAVLHCTSAGHGHAPGRYSVHRTMDEAIALAEAARVARPDLFLVWYWGFESPWWLKWGDVMFDKGMKLEAASPASVPAASWRQGVSLNLDQAVRHAALTPLALQDSLGVWIGEAAWCNRMGTEGWREALLLDLARGSGLISVWGDLGLLDGEDRAFLAAVLRWQRSWGDAWRRTREVGGDPWRAEPYGYAQRGERGTVVTLTNPSFAARATEIELDPGVISECYPYPGLVSLHSGGRLEFDLHPWEVRVLEVLPESSIARPDSQRRAAVPASRPLDLSQVAQVGSRISGSVTLPEIVRHDLVVVGMRLHRDGVWSYHPEPQSLFSPAFRLGAGSVLFKTIPRVRSWNGQGCPWVLYELPAGPAWSGASLEMSWTTQLPAGVEAEPFGVVYSDWRRACPPSFADPRGGVGSGSPL
jgi:hypothetical protein